MRNHCAGLASDLVARRHLGDEAWALRGRITGPGAGQVSAFGTPHTLTFERAFADRLDQWALNTNHWIHQASPPTARRTITWIGEVGSMACHRPTAAHNRARGLDLCQLRLTDGDFVDMNASHAGSLTHQRRYLAVAASLRRFFGTVLTRHYNAAHRDHIHVDDLTAVAPIRTSKRTDTTLVQSAANLLGGAAMPIDGVWGERTEAGYRHLLDAFGMACTAPKESVPDASLFLQLVVRTALADAAAGAIRTDVCGPCAAPPDAVSDLVCEAVGLLG